MNIILFCAILFSVQAAFFPQQLRSLQSISLNHDEFSYRKLVEQLNLRHIHEHNQRQISFQLSSNQFISLTFDEFTAKMGSSPQNTKVHQSINPPQIGATITISTNFSVDWLASGKVSPIKNQGSSCSSCYAFTAIADMQSSYLMSYGKLYDFSQQQLVDCSSKFGNNYCGSGFYLYSFLYIIKNGVNLQQNYPYQGVTSTCKVTASKSFLISSYYGYNGNSCNLLTSLLFQRPVIVSIDGANKYWQFYSSGILNYCGSSNTLNHGVQVIAIYSFANGTNYYVIKNSWGTNWGEQGKMRIDRNVNNGNLCEICSFMYNSKL